jgi:hypothetical protein
MCLKQTKYANRNSSSAWAYERERECRNNNIVDPTTELPAEGINEVNGNF